MGRVRGSSSERGVCVAWSTQPPAICKYVLRTVLEYPRRTRDYDPAFEAGCFTRVDWHPEAKKEAHVPAHARVKMAEVP
jgi:hypothetical protein